MPFLLSLPGLALSLAKRIGGFIGKLQPFQLISLALAALCLFLWLNGASARRQAAKWKAQTADCIDMREMDRRNIEAASKQASAQNKAEVLADETKRATISKESNDAYQADLAALRDSYARRLRAQAGADQGRAGTGGVSPVPVAASGVNGQAVPLSSDDRLAAAETELQLNALVDWNRRQSAIDPNK